jgi:hypothetical protein
VSIRSVTPGTAFTISAASTSLTNVDFRDITGAGAAAWTGTAVGNALGNSGITFTTPVTRYGVVAGNWSNTATWSTSSGGGGGSSVPLPQDAVILDGGSAAGSYVVDMPRLCADLTMTDFTRTFNVGTNTDIYGSYAGGTGMTLSGTSDITFRGRSSHTIGSAGKTFGGRVDFVAPGGTYTLTSALTCSRSFNPMTVHAGTFNDGGFALNLTADGFFTVQTTGSINFSGTTTLNATSAGNAWVFTGSGTVTHTGTIVLAVASTNSRTFAGGGKTYGTLTYTVAGSTGALVITGQNTFATINFSDVTNARTLTLPTSSGITITGTFNVNGTSGKLMTVTGDVTKASGTVSCDYLSLSSSDAAGGAAFYAGANSTNGGSNTGWIFTAPPAATGATGDSAGRSLNRLAGTTGLDAQGAANVWAGTVGKDLVGALNTKAGGTRLEYNGVCQLLASQLGGTTGLDAQGSLASIP